MSGFVSVSSMFINPTYSHALTHLVGHDFGGIGCVPRKNDIGLVVIALA